MDKIQAFANEQLKTEIPQFEIGDSIVVHNKIKEGARERIQLFDGVVIAKKNGGISATFTVRKMAYGIGVEKTFPLHSPNVVKVDVPAAVRFAVLNSTTFVNVLVRQQRLKK